MKGDGQESQGGIASLTFLGAVAPVILSAPREGGGGNTLMNRLLTTSMAIVFLLAAGGGKELRAADAGPGAYLPLAVGTKWVLRSPLSSTPAIFEVLERDGKGFRIRSSHPWGSSEWTLDPEDGKLVMTAYGDHGQLMPLPARPLYLDFTRGAGANWTNSLGTFTVVSTTAVVQAGGQTYRNCIHIRHKASSAVLDFIFARGIGYVQFGPDAAGFVLDPSASRLPGGSTGPASGPKQAVAVEPSRLPAPPPRRNSRSASSPILFGLTFNRFANEPLTLDVMMRRFQQTLDAGVNFIVGNGNWSEIEPRKGQYDLGNVNPLISIATSNQLPIYYCLHVIANATSRDVPQDLQRRSWADPEMHARVLRLIETLAPLLKNRARWFSFGYEIDGYFEKRPAEVKDFVELQRIATARMKELVPDIRVSTTLTYDAVNELKDRFADLNRQIDFLALTYSPLKPDFTVAEPSAVTSDFARMRQFAANRKIVLQEIAYPTSAATGSNEDKQSEFYRNAFQDLARNPTPFEAVNFMMLADLSDADTEKFSQFYGMKNSRSFRGAIQTLGMFDMQGRPKKGWDAFRQGLAH